MSKPGDVYVKGPIELRCGDYREVLADVEPDAVITDPPYGARTHGGQRHGRRLSGSGHWCSTRGLGYDGWGRDEVAEFVARWLPSDGWLVPLTSHDLIGEYQGAVHGAGGYAFAPVPGVIVGMNVRLAGDGPSSWCVYAVPARPRSLRAWGTLPGAYVGNREPQIVEGGKPLWLMRALVRDYSRPGDLVCDPCAGGATTLIAAALEGRRSIGAELDPVTYDKACARIERTALTPPLRGLDVEPMRGEQRGIFDDEEAAQ